MKVKVFALVGVYGLTEGVWPVRVGAIRRDQQAFLIIFGNRW